MAKKEAKELTPEEKLAQIIVPENEYEYQIPNNWRWIILGNLVSIKRGASPRPIKAFLTTDDENGVNWIKIGDSDSGKYITSIKEKITESGAKKSVFVAKGTLLLSNSMSFGRPYILAVDGCIHDGWLAITPGKVFDKEYLYYALLASEWYFERVAVGTAVRNLNSDRVAATPIPLPPLSEQQRIVDRIESLFAKLDEAKEAAQIVVDGFEDRKAAILHKAFTGELTAEWRKKNGTSIEEWETKKLLEVGTLQTGLMKGKKFKSETVLMPYLRVANVQDGYLDLSEIKEIEVEIEQVPRYMLRDEDVLFTEGGDYDKLGRGTVWHEEIPNCLHQNHIFVVRTDKDQLLPEFLSLETGSKYGKRYFISCSKQTTNLASINSTQLKNFPVLLPSIEEQKEIVGIIRDLVDKEENSKEAAETVLDQIDIMKKSILGRAFRGELGTNDTNDEPAMELLKRILNESNS